jgi:hypothetical protein
MMNTFHDHFKKMGAGKRRLDWASKFDTAREAWEACENGEWLLNWCASLEINRKLRASAAADCLELTLPYAGNARALRQLIIDKIKKWIDGHVPHSEVRAAQEKARCVSVTFPAGVMQQILRQSADIVRTRIPWTLVREALVKCGGEPRDLESAGEVAEVAS